MYGIIRTGNRKSYMSYIYGYYCPISAIDDYQRYLESIYNQYYLVLNEEKTQLVRQYLFNRKSKHLDPRVIIVDDAKEWEVKEGCVPFLNGYDPASIIEDITQDDLLHCIELDASFVYAPIQQVLDQQSADKLMYASGGFHDAYIKEWHAENDQLYVLFDGIWGCQIEVWFEGDVSWCMDSRDPEEWDAWWMCATVGVSDGWVYLVDEEDTKLENIDNTYCWFKARTMRYRIIPNP